MHSAQPRLPLALLTLQFTSHLHRIHINSWSTLKHYSSLKRRRLAFHYFWGIPAGQTACKTKFNYVNLCRRGSGGDSLAESVVLFGCQHLRQFVSCAGCGIKSLTVFVKLRGIPFLSSKIPWQRRIVLCSHSRQFILYFRLYLLP